MVARPDLCRGLDALDALLGARRDVVGALAAGAVDASILLGVGGRRRPLVAAVCKEQRELHWGRQPAVLQVRASFQGALTRGRRGLGGVEGADEVRDVNGADADQETWAARTTAVRADKGGHEERTRELGPGGKQSGLATRRHGAKAADTSKSVYMQAEQLRGRDKGPAGERHGGQAAAAAVTQRRGPGARAVGTAPPARAAGAAPPARAAVFAAAARRRIRG